MSHLAFGEGAIAQSRMDFTASIAVGFAANFPPITLDIPPQSMELELSMGMNVSYEQTFEWIEEPNLTGTWTEEPGL